LASAFTGIGAAAVYGVVRPYLDLIRAPGAGPLLIGGTIGRIPYGMEVVAIILLLRAAGLSYAEVGLVTGIGGVTMVLTSPAIARLVDRLGQTPVLLTTAVLSLATQAGLLAAAVSGAGVVPIALLAAAAGAVVPPVSPCMRTLWPELVERDRLDTAYAFDALQLEVFFIVGPLLAAGIATAVSPEAAYATSFTLEAVGGLVFAASRVSRRWRPAERDEDEPRPRVLGTPGLRTLFGSLAVGAVALGVLEIGIAAFAEREGSRSDTGWLFAVWGLGSLVGGLWYGARRWRATADVRFLWVSGALAVGLAPLPLAGSLPVFAVLVAVAGLGLAPSTAAAYSLVGELAPPEAMTEAYAWQIVAYVGGASVGAWLAGALVEGLSVEAALACAPVVAAGALAVAVSGRRSLAPRQPA
jgi:MFS family permease